MSPETACFVIEQEEVMRKKIKNGFILAGLSLFLVACGGGGGGGGNSPPENNNWDQMVWDQDNWS